MQTEIRFHRLDEQDYLKELNSLVKLSRNPDEKGSLDMKPFVRTVERAVREISVKKRRGEAISEHEKWLFENSHLVKRAFVRYSEKSVALPSKDGEPRIVSIVRFALYHTEPFTRAALIKTLRAVGDETALTLRELEALPSALAYISAEGISIVADRVLYRNRMKYRAEKEAPNPKFYTSDVYNFYLLAASVRKEETEAELRSHGVNPVGAEAAFTLSVLENDELARKFFTTLQNVGEIAPEYETLPTLSSYRILAKSPTFRKMSFDTQRFYLGFAAETAKKTKRCEDFIAEKLFEFEKARGNGSDTSVFEGGKAFRRFVKTGKIESRRRNRGRGAGAYFASILLFGALATVAAALLVQSLFALFLFVPLCFVSENLINRALGKRRKHRFLPRMNFTEVPPSARTLVVVSEYVGNLEQLKASVERLRVLRAGNGAGAIEFSLLLDFAASDGEETPSDEALLAYLRETLSDDGFNAFVRKRVFDGKRYSGRERKRGAIEELNFALETGNESAFRLILKKPRKPEFIVLLDGDNTVEPGGILEMVNLIAHPANADYDLLSAAGRYRLATPKTAYSKRFFREGGLESYPHYSSFFFDLFGREIFCGKGIYRLRAYSKKLLGIFPEKKILSHDILEGAVLNTASGGVVYEEAPETFFQEEARKTRWHRGDLQLLPFLGRSWKNDSGEKYRSEIPFFYRALIVRNALCVLSPALLFAAVSIGFFFNFRLTAAAAIVAMFPFLIDFVSEIRTLAEKRKLRYALRSILNSFCRNAEELFLMPYRAVKNAFVIFSTASRMLGKRNLLEWKTFFMSKSASANALIKSAVPPLILLTAMTVLAFFFASVSVIPLAAEAVLTLLTLSALAAESRPRRPKKPYRPEFLYDVAERTVKYFDLIRSDKLPSDNFQERPYRGLAKVTSPTDMGFALLADVSAFYLGVRDREETVENLSLALDKYEKLKKWKGNLLNWYRLDGTPAGSFVSGVDSGNFLAALTLVRNFFREIGEKELAEKADRLASETDLDALFDRDKKLMYLGYDVKTKKYNGHYDMLMSESRLTSYLQAARSRDPAVFRNLARDYTGRRGNTLLSWSGTMFEYLMAAIFLRAPEGSLLDESERRAVEIQMRRRFRGAWGRSEGGYHAFDEDLNYQYYAIGEELLSLRNEKNKPVVAPYGSALAILKKPRAAIENLLRLKKLGAYGMYGFYEGVDFTEGKPRVVESYMTHHQGMMLAAITNYLKGDILARLFQNSEEVESAALLMTEKTSETVYPVKTAKISKIIEKIHLEYYDKSTNQEYQEKIFGLTDRKFSIMADNLGNNAARFGKILSGRPYRADGAPAGGFFYVETKGGFRCPTASPTFEKGGEFESGQTESELFFVNRTAGLKLEIRKNDNFGAVTRRLTIDAPTGKQVRVAYVEELVLNGEDAYLSHPVFNGMFVETSYLAEKKTIIAEKRSGEETGDRWFALSIRGLDKLFVETDRMKLIGRGRTPSDPLILENFKEEGEADVGDVLEPTFGFSGLTELSKDGKAIVETTEFTAGSKEELLRILDAAPLEFFRYAEKSESENLYRDGFAADFASKLFLSKRAGAAAELAGGESKLFREYNRDGIGILFRSGRSAEPFERLVRAAISAESFGLRVFINVLPPNNPDAGTGESVKDAADKLFFRNYRILAETESKTAETYSFMTLDETLAIPETAILSDRIRTLRIKNGKPLPIEGESFPIGGSIGGFLEDGDFLLTGKPALPFANVVAFGAGGFTATEEGGGFSFFGNSRENKLTEFRNDPVSDPPGEFLLFGSKTFKRINRGASATRFSPGKITYYSRYSDLSARVEAYLIDDGKVRILEAEVASNEKNPSLYFGLIPALDWKASPSDIVFFGEKDVLKIKNMKTGSTASVRVVSEAAFRTEISGENERIPWIKAEFGEKDVRAFIAVSEKESATAKLTPAEILSKKSDALNSVKNFSAIEINTGDAATDILFNRWLMPQIRFSRLGARAAYYQVGGAVGFRDQLQDVVALLSTEPERVRQQILTAAAHQYKEGDVQHWWHPPRFGVRTRISDDKLFLPLVTGKYLRATGDRGILKEELPYLVSDPLKPSEKNRLEYPKESTETETLSKHCLRALKNAMRYGENGLLILGTGDWNDGMDDAGKRLKGESVVTSLLFVWAVEEFSDFMEDGNLRAELKGVAEKLKESIRRNAVRNGRFFRLRADDGRWYGTGEGALKVDLVSESLAVLSGTAAGEDALKALGSAEELIDRELKIVKLLSPPLGKKNYLGYISKYPKGVRENGGQYTHAAIWYLMALAKAGKPDEAYELFKMINPVEKYRDPEVYARYLGEPFVLSGDVYASKRNPGRMGWSWYTGSAAWCYHFLSECLFGVRRVGNELEIKPNLPAALDGAELLYRYRNSEYRVMFRKTGAKKLTMDGVTLETEGKVPLFESRRAEIAAEY